MMDRAERELLAATVATAISAAHTAANDHTPVDAALTDLGWLDMLTTEPADAIAIVFAALGSHDATAGALDDVIAHALGIEVAPGVSVLLPPFAQSDAPGRIESGVLRATGLGTSRTATATGIAVVARDGARHMLATNPATEAQVQRVRGVDPHAGVYRVTVGPLLPDPAAWRELEPATWAHALATGRRAIGHQIHGCCRAMLDLARTHALERVQFDRPIAHFQAVRHRLADALVAIEALAATLGAAADDGTPLTAALAKATAGRTARVVSAHCQQVLAGIGFTTDHAFHRFSKRTMLLDGLLGSAEQIVVEVGHELLNSRTVPTLIELEDAIRGGFLP